MLCFSGNGAASNILSVRRCRLLRAMLQESTLWAVLLTSCFCFRAETTNSQYRLLPVNVLFCFCVAGLLWCGKTGLQWRWWQTLCKLFGGNLFYCQHPLSFHRASPSAASTEDRCYWFFYFCSPCCEFHPLNCISCCGRNLGVRVGLLPFKVHLRPFYLPSKQLCSAASSAGRVCIEPAHRSCQASLLLP